MNQRAPLLEIRDLRLDFVSAEQTLRALDGISFHIADGETVCLVGESGSGKTITALSIARLLPSPPARYVSGQILLQGQDVLGLTPSELRRLRGGVVSYIFQDPSASLNPVLRVGRQIREALALHRPPEAATDAEVIRLLRLVGIPAPETRRHDYPHQLSGGMQQRVMIAMALASEPKLLIADEPTTALDVTIQAQILELLRELKERLGMSILLITHNLGLVNELGDRVLVMYAGQIVEEAPAETLLRSPCHPYTQALLRSVPQLGGDRERLEAIPGNVPQLGAWPSGCRFHPRCPIAASRCAEHSPTLDARPNPAGSIFVRCPYAH
jgi:oligopeptide/dipeptide ABC transporter ATP-binding protein